MLGHRRLRATVDPQVEHVKPLPLTLIHLFATYLYFGNVGRVYRYAKDISTESARSRVNAVGKVLTQKFDVR
jgi:hypothetical protein